MDYFWPWFVLGRNSLNVVEKELCVVWKADLVTYFLRCLDAVDRWVENMLIQHNGQVGFFCFMLFFPSYYICTSFQVTNKLRRGWGSVKTGICPLGFFSPIHWTFLTPLSRFSFWKADLTYIVKQILNQNCI